MNTFNFQIQALPDTAFTHLFDLSDQELQQRGASRMTVDRKPGFPCRISLQDAEVGEAVLLLHYQHHQTDAPYRAGGPIFVRRNAPTAQPQVNEIPQMLRHRLLSVRAYNAAGWMLQAIVVEGTQLEETIQQLFGDPAIQYLHIHNAKPGCYNCSVVRVNS